MNTSSLENWRSHPWAGVLAATLCPFHQDESIDVLGLKTYLREVLAVDGINGVVTNGHTGEIMSLLPSERAQVTAIAVEAA